MCLQQYNPSKCLLSTRTEFSRVPALICHCEERSDVATSMRLNTRRRTIIATVTRLPRYARNDKVGTLGNQDG